MNALDLINVIVNATGSILVVVGLIYAARQVKLETKAHTDNHDWNRRLAAQEILAQADPVGVMNELGRKLNYSERSAPIELASLLDLFDKEPELRVGTIQLMNRFESLARGIMHGIYDEDVVRDAKRGVMIRVYSNFLPLIEYRREHINENSYAQWQHVVEAWLQNQRAVPKRPRIGDN